MKKLLTYLAVLASLSTAVHATILDPFTSNDTGNYTFYARPINAPTTTGSISDFVAADGKFAPDAPADNADFFELKSGVALTNVGDSVSLDITLPGAFAPSSFDLGLSLSFYGTPDISSLAILLMRTSEGYTVDNGSSNGSVDYDGPVTLTITKTDLTSFGEPVLAITATGGVGFTPIATTITTEDDIVGLADQNNSGTDISSDPTDGPFATDFEFFTIPEPSSTALLGVTLLLGAGVVTLRKVRAA